MVMNTLHAPAERADFSKVLQDLDLFQSFENVNELVNALPYIAAVLNKERQIVYGNSALLQAMGFSRIDDIVGLRPGELLQCVNAAKNEAGCGTSENCRYCGAVNAIMACMNSGSKITSECRIVAMANQKEVSYDFSVTASPFTYQGESFVVLSFHDISDEKRRRVLEKIFFHDIINTAGGIRGFLDFVSASDDPSEMREYLHIANKLSENLVDEIMAQRQLLAAERGELKTDFKPIDANSLLEVVKNHLEHHFVGQRKQIIVNPGAETWFESDPVLLKRVLINLLKNALEASREGQKVSLGFESAAGMIHFWVHNETFIHRKIQLQIFQRSFSTKDQSRGLGTYSIKLLTEQYLKGRVNFSSDETTGTQFNVWLPVKSLGHNSQET